MAARCLLLVWVKSAKGIPRPRANVFQERGRCWAYCHRVVLSWALFPAMVATGTDWVFANLFWMRVMIWRK